MHSNDYFNFYKASWKSIKFEIEGFPQFKHSPTIYISVVCITSIILR